MRAARDRGSKAFAETCPQYLFLSLDDLGNGFEGAKFVCSPPLRPKDHWDDLWTGLVKDDLQLVSTDHCPFDFHGQKELGQGRLPQGPQRPAGRRGPGRPAPRRRRRRRPDPQGALGRDHLDGTGQAVRDVPEEGRDRGRLRRRPRRSTTRTGGARSRRRPTTWTSTTRATRAARCRALSDVVLSPRVGHRARRGVHRPQRRREVRQALARRLRPDRLTGDRLPTLAEIDR